MTSKVRRRFEWPTLALLLLCYSMWAAAVMWTGSLGLPLAVLLCTLSITLHSSIQHETLHGPTCINQWISEVLVALPIGLFVPYGRFKTTHLEHHKDSRLTDPYDDPESNFLDPGHWDKLTKLSKATLGFNNTLLGRLLIGPAVGQFAFMKCDLKTAQRGDARVIREWLGHVAALCVLVVLLWRFGAMPVWAYLVSAYAGLSILKIRTFLEHRAHEKASGRTVIIEDRGPLALLFLNNNFHAVHHCHPTLPWYDLPARYRAHKEMYLARNDGYVYASYLSVFKLFFLRRKDPVPHPLWRQN